MNADELFEQVIDPALQPILEQFYSGAEDETILRDLRQRGFPEADAQRMLAEAERIFEAMPESEERRQLARRGRRMMLTAILLIPAAAAGELFAVYVLRTYLDEWAIAFTAVIAVVMFFAGLVTWLRNRG